MLGTTRNQNLLYHLDYLPKSPQWSNSEPRLLVWEVPMSVLGLVFEHPSLAVAFLILIVLIVQSLHRIGPMEVGLVTKRFGWK